MKLREIPDRVAMWKDVRKVVPEPVAPRQLGTPQSDLILAEQLKDSTNPDAKALLAAMAVPKKKATRKGAKP